MVWDIYDGLMSHMGRDSYRKDWQERERKIWKRKEMEWKERKV